MTYSIPSVEALGLSISKKGYIIANKKNCEKLLSLPFVSVKSERFSGMVDGMAPVEVTIEKAKEIARDVIASGRAWRGVAIYGPDSSTSGLPSVSIGDCCYDVTFFLNA